MNIAILEDSINDCAKIKEILARCQQMKGINLEIDLFMNGETFLLEGINKSYHLILMDIYIGDTDGIELAERVQNIQDDVLMVYLTNSDTDIWRAVKTHNCFDYIQKSELTIERISNLIDDVIRKLKLNEIKISFFSGKQKIDIKLRDIQYVLSHDKYSSIIFKDNHEQRYRITFSQLYALLKDNSYFLLCNRGVLLNMDFIKQANRDSFEMADGMIFPLRRKDKRGIMDRYNEYQFEKLDTVELF